jgi:asparagine synthase (glutamine-hydrolysing)
MCGFVGVVRNGRRNECTSLEQMTETLHHRGPDCAGIWWSQPDGRVGLGHRRLSIIDLAERAAQPMHSPDGDATLVFNGEIYNYRELRIELERAGRRFRTESDTEVVLEAYRTWGDESVSRLDGMFALAVYDSARQRVLLARDRVGEKPLFYSVLNGVLRFASELKALFADPDVPRALDPDALEEYLAFGFVPGSMCMIRGINKLPPGHVGVFDLQSGTLDVRRYWSLPAAPPSDVAPAQELVDRLERLLQAAVQRQLVADVPVGVLLSGGIDSSIVAALAARASSSPVNTFTITFPGHGSFDEGPFARQVASHIGSRHIELEAEPAAVGLLPELARQFDEPLADSSIVPTALLARLVRQHATVALGGDGGDELFGGYAHYRILERQSRLRAFVPRMIRRPAGKLAGMAPAGVRGRRYVMGLCADQLESISNSRILFDAAARNRLLVPLSHRRGAAGAPELRAVALAHGSTLLQSATRLDFATYLPDDILVKVDRASMLASLEVRAPWLDRAVVEFAFGSVPDVLKSDGRSGKLLPRMLAARLLPPSLDLTRKQGFAIPLPAWFAGEWGTFMEDVLAGVDPGLFSRRAVTALIRGQRSNRSNSERLFALTFFELWRREYGVTL